MKKYYHKLLCNLAAASENHKKYPDSSFLSIHIFASNKAEKFARKDYTAETINRTKKKTTRKIFGVEM